MVGLRTCWDAHGRWAEGGGHPRAARPAFGPLYPIRYLPALPCSHPTQEHWKYGGHKKACPAYVVAAAAQAQQDRLCKKAHEAEQCLICLEPPVEPTTLPCGHAFCTACVVELRAKGVSETCPLCRSPLPPGPEKLFELGYRVWAKLNRALDIGGANDGTWRELSASQQGEVDGAIVMLQEAMDQVSVLGGDSMVQRALSLDS